MEKGRKEEGWRYQTYDRGIDARVWTRSAWRSVASSSMFVSILFGFSF
jgi:hypothetical protein